MEQPSEQNSFESAGHALPIVLPFAVYLRMMNLQRLTQAERDARMSPSILEHISHMIAEKGDRLLFRSNRKGETAEVFNALAEGIAILSFAPGGVRIFGKHYESKPESRLPEKLIENIRLGQQSLFSKIFGDGVER